MVREWGDHSRIKEENRYEEGGDNTTIQAISVSAAQSVNKNDADLNCIDKTWPKYHQEMLVM